MVCTVSKYIWHAIQAGDGGGIADFIGSFGALKMSICISATGSEKRITMVISLEIKSSAE